jgi:hypothetical protein
VFIAGVGDETTILYHRLTLINPLSIAAEEDAVYVGTIHHLK